MVTLDDLSEPAPPPGPADWNDEGVVVLPGLIPPDMIAAYAAEWKQANGWHGVRRPAGRQVSRLVMAEAGSVEDVDQLASPLYSTPPGVGAGRWLIEADRPGGWEDCTPYMRHGALREICCYGPLAEALERLIGEPAGVHLNLTGWVSTERDWHQDGYLNPPPVGDHYAAVWIALGPVHPESGPFEYVPGSHRWHRLVRERFAGVVDLSDPAWPRHSEDVLTPLLEERLERMPVDAVQAFLPQAPGDVLIWHPRLYHRGSRAVLPGAYRPALIAHFSGIRHRPDMPAPRQHPLGGWYFPIVESGPRT